MVFDDGSDRIIGAAIEVHRSRGPGFAVVELKAVRRLEDIHFAIVRSYLKAVGREHVLLLNFAGTKLDIQRVISLWLSTFEIRPVPELTLF